MKIPESAPNWEKLFTENSKWLIENVNNEELTRLANKANKEYLYWDRAKYLPLPSGISAERFWLYMKFIRVGQQKRLPFKDKVGNSFNYWLPDEILKNLQFIDKHTSSHQVFGSQSMTQPEKSRYLLNALMEEAIASSQLEGAATTREAAKLMLRSGKRPTNLSEQMIVNNYLTMQDLKTLGDRPFTVEAIKKIQATITRDTLEKPECSGRFRNGSDDKVYVVDDRDNTVLFDPPVYSEIEERMNILCDFANNDGLEYCHPVIKAIIIHFGLSYIHPFIDGNGRTARALFYWYLIKKDYWTFEYLSISRILKKAPAQYARAFVYTEMDQNDLSYFIQYNMRAICIAIEEFDLYIKNKNKERSRLVYLTRNHNNMNFRQAEIIEKSMADPHISFTVKRLQNTFNIVKQTARTDLLGLVKEGFLIQKRIGREYYFIPIEGLKERLEQLQENN